jgi:ABC-type transporter Mla MlaB component
MMAEEDAVLEPLIMHDPLADLDWDDADEPAAMVAGGIEPVAPQPAELPELPMDSDGTVLLGDSLAIQDVAEALEKFRSALELGDTLRIGAADLEQVDGAGLQLLCAVVRAARAQAIDVVWEGTSKPLREAAENLGLDMELAL